MKNPFAEIERIKKEFWDYPNYPFLNEQTTQYYTENYDRLRSNALRLLEQHPIECASFWIELVRSKFILKFGHDINSILNHKDEILTTEKAIRVIKTVFESSYQYFGFFAICEYMEQGKTSNLYQYWQNPTKAKEMSKKGETNPWAIGKTKVSGKVWATNMCPLFKFCPVDLDILKRIRNAEGHEKIIVKDEKVFLFDKKVLTTFTKEEIVGVANYLKGVINLCMHFYLTLLIRDRFWLFLCIFYANDPKQKFDKLPFEIWQKEKDDKKEETESEKKKSGWGFFLILILFCIKYVTSDLWREIKGDVPKLNTYLSKMGLAINEPQIDTLHKGALADLYNALVFVNQDVRKMLRIDKNKFNEIVPEDADNVEFMEILGDTIEIMQDYMNKKEGHRAVYIMIIAMLGTLTALVQPFQRLMDNLRNLVRPVA